MIPFPSDGQWKAALGSDLFGLIMRSKNLDFDRQGYASLAKNAVVLYSETDNSDFKMPVAIVSDNTNLYVVPAGGSVWSIPLADNSLVFNELSSTREPTLGFDSDAVFYQGNLHVSGGTAFNDWNGSTWHNSTRYNSLSSSYPHPMCVSEHQNFLAVGDGNLIKLFDTSYALNTTCTLDAQYIVECIRWRGNDLYIGTRNINGGDAKLFIWDGSGSAAQQAYGVQANWIYSIAEYQSSMALVTSSGEVLRFNGGGFDQLAAFPVYYTPYSWDSNAANTNLVGNVASRGMQAHGDKLYINIQGDVTGGSSDYLPEMPGGLWVLDPNVGLYHKAGYGYLTHLSLAVSDVASNYLVFGTSHQALVGDPVLCSAQSGISGIAASQLYYAVPDNNGTNTFRLALSPADALAGRTIAISGTPNGDTFQLYRYESAGSTRNERAGGILVFSSTHPQSFYGEQVIFGGRPYLAGLSNKGMLMSLGLGRNRGYFVTPRIPSSQVTDVFQRLIAFFDTLNFDTDQIVLKYRSRERLGSPGPLAVSGVSATWTSSTTFTIDTTGKDFKSVQVGDEIEVVEGAGAGYLAHITKIDTTNPLYVGTIDETMPVSSGSFDFIADNWTKLRAITNADESNALGLASLPLDTTSTWVQFKPELRGVGTRIRQFRLINATSEKAQ